MPHDWRRNLALSFVLFLCVFIIGLLRLRSDIFYRFDIMALSLVQSFRSSAMDIIMNFFTLLGDEVALILFGASLYWFGMKEKSIVYAAVFIFSQVANLQTKSLLGLGRPSSCDAIILAHETTAGFPSNHAQNGMFMFSFFGWLEKRISLVFIMGICVGLSRVYLGVHYPTDVLGGWLMGAAFFFLTLAAIDFAGEGGIAWLYDSLAKKVVLSILFACLIFFFGTEWDIRLKVSSFSLGIFFGFGMIKERWRFASLKNFFISVAIGGLGVLFLKMGVEILIPGRWMFIALRFMLLGLWVAAAPLLFLKMGLSEKKS